MQVRAVDEVDATENGEGEKQAPGEDQEKAMMDCLGVE